MNKLHTTIIAFLVTTTIWAQSPLKMSYQAVIRNSSNQLVVNQNVGMKISILQGSATGTVVYTETKMPTTNANGLVIIEIGGEIGFDAINWANGPYFIKTETDPTGSANYTIIGTSQILSVPYAFHAKTAEGITGGITETDPIFVSSPSKEITSASITNWNTAFGWGNHASAGYLTGIHEKSIGELSDVDLTGISDNKILKYNNALSKWLVADAAGVTETDPIFSTWDKSSGISVSASQVSDFQTNVTNNTAVLANTAKNSYPAADASKLAGIAPGAEVNVNADWNATDGDAQILNKPIFATVATSGNYNDLTNKISAGTGISINGSNQIVNTAPDQTISFTGNDLVTVTGTYPMFTLGLQNFRFVNDENIYIGIASGSNSLVTTSGNIFLGHFSGFKNTSGSNNLFIGRSSGEQNTNGTNNTFIGELSGQHNNGYCNVFVGGFAGNRNTTGLSNSFFGMQTGGFNTSGNNNSLFGSYANLFNALGSNNTMIGHESGMGVNGQSNSNSNTFIGAQSGKSTTTGSENVFIGYQSGYSNTTAGNLIFIGYLSGYNNTTGWANTFIGDHAGMNNTIGESNTFLGYLSGQNNTVAKYNTFLGTQAGSSNSTGENNVYIGFNSGTSNNVGSNNTLIGAGAGGSNLGSGNVFIGRMSGFSELGSNKLVISNTNTTSPLIYGEFDNQKLIVNGKTTINDVMNISPRNSAPANPSEGDIYYDGTAHTVKFYNGTEWISMGVQTQSLPTVYTSTASQISINSVTFNGGILSIGSSSITARGFCWSTTENPTLVDFNYNLGSGTTGPFAWNCTTLTPNTTYYVKAYATNSVGTSYGSQESFTTPVSASVPVMVMSTTVNGVTSSSANFNGGLSSNGGSPLTGCGFCWSTNPNPTINNNVHNLGSSVAGPYSWNCTSLSPNTTYYVRAYATNSAGTGYSNEVSFTTAGAEGLTIGQSYQGGVIAYILQPGDPGYVAGETKGLIVAPVDLSVPSEWGCEGSEISGADGSELGSGNQNTIDILSGCATSGIAARKCRSLNIGGYSDWFLPSKDELNKLYLNRIAIGGLGTNSGTYWSSSETSANTAWCIDFSNGTWYSAMVKTSFSYFRAVRSFTTVTAAVLPTLTTTTATSITSTSATSGGDVSSDGGAAITARGVCWSASQNPLATGSHTTDGSGIGTFTSSITGLTANTTYYLRAYATNSVGTTYGNEVNFTTKVSENPIIFNPNSTYDSVLDIDGNTYKTIVIGTQEWMAENLKTTKYNDGSPIPLITDNTEWVNSATGEYCWYNNDEATYKNTYGALYNWETVNTNKLCPTGWHVPDDSEWNTLNDFLGGNSIAGGKLKESGITHWTSPNDGVTNETGFTALSGGCRGNGGAFVDMGCFGFWWTSNEDAPESAISRVMNCYSSLFVGRGPFAKTDGFSVRCMKSAGTTNSLPVLTTTTITAVSSTSATTGGNISLDGGATITARGVVYSTTQNPTLEIHGGITNDGTGTGEFTSNLSGLASNTTYYIKAYATNSVGTAYGNEVSFTTSVSEGEIVFNPNLTYGSVSDVDGNTYKTVVIGTQEWMAENLKTTKYRDGSSIPNIIGGAEWIGLTTGAYCLYNNDNSKTTYGLLYNFYAAIDNRNLCPSGWHVPSDIEWGNLASNLSGESLAGSKLKEVGLSHWLSPNYGADNSSGFTALPGGGRNGYDGTFFGLGATGQWWSTTVYEGYLAWFRSTEYNNASFYNNTPKMQQGVSIRCIKGEVQALPILATIMATSITSTTVTSGGNISSDGGAAITARGVCWSTSQNPVVSDSHTADGSGTGVFTSSITGLTANTTYYLRAYATNSVGTAYGNQISFTTTNETVIKIGASYAGGIIFYIDNTGTHGLVCAPFDQDNGSGASWGCNQVSIPGADETYIGYGLQNTVDIINACPESNIAARLCYDLVLNGYDDWYLPSIDELAEMKVLYDSGIGNISDQSYWSSTENSASLAIRYWFGNNSVDDRDKTNTYKIRAIRNF